MLIIVVDFGGEFGFVLVILGGGVMVSGFNGFTEYGEANQFEIEEVIGKESYGVVASAIDTHTGGVFLALHAFVLRGSSISLSYLS